MTIFEKTLPASWYRSKSIYDLEKRAVFLKSWLFLGPITKFEHVGTVVDYEIAQVKMFVRRVSPAPRDIAIFDEEYREMRSHVTKTGLLFGAVSDDAPSFDEYFPNIETLLCKVDFTKLPYRRSLKYEGKFNWKTMVDGYQECLHCQYTHPSFSVYYPPTFYTVYNYTNFCQHVADPNKQDDGLFLYFFPNCTLNVYGGGMSSFRVCPTSKPGVTRMEFDYFNQVTGDEFEDYYKFTRVVAMEDFELCEKAQANLEKGIYDIGILNPVKETGVAYYQKRVLDLVYEQHEADKKARSSVIPASDLQ